MQVLTMTPLVMAVIAVGVLGLGAEGSGLPHGRELDRIVTSTPRPSILLNRAELDALRHAVRVDGWQREAYLRPLQPGDSEYAGESVLVVADKWLKTEIRIPTRGGHGHSFFCNCGTQLTLPPDLEPRATYVCPACGKTYSGARYDDAVRLFKHHALANAAMQLALAYEIEEKRGYAAKAAEILRRYAEAYPGPHTNATTGGILYQSLNEAMWVIPLAQAYDLIYSSASLSDADRRSIEDRLFKPVARGLIHCGVGGNWGSWHLCAVGVIGFAVKDPSLVDYALKAFQKQMADYLGDDGLWPESVHCYHFFALHAFVYLAEAAFRSGIDLYDYQAKPGKGLKRMFAAPLEYMYPSFRLPAVNDGWYEMWLPLSLYEVAHRRWPDSSFAWVLKNGYAKEAVARKEELERSMGYISGGALNRFLFGAKLPVKPGPPAFLSTNYANFGLCTLRNDRAMLTFHYGRFLGHGHLDKLSFTLYANDDPSTGSGCVLLPDYGTPGYGSSILHWYQSTASHNTVVVDGKSQARSKEAAINVFHAGEVAQYAEASASDCYPGVKQTRKILLVGKACLIVDDLTADAEHDFDWLLHCEGQPEVTGSYTAEHLDTAMYPNAAFDRTERFGDGYRVDWKTAGSSLALGMWAGSDGGFVGLGKCPAETDARHASFLMCRKHGREARFVAALVPSKLGESVRLTRDGSTLRVAAKGETDCISVRGLGDVQAQADLTTDGEIAAVRARGGEVTGAVLVHGTWIKWKGKTLIERAAKVDCAEVAF